MKKLPSPEELGEWVEAGKMTEAEAVEIMSERARRTALAGLYGPLDDDEESQQDAQKQVPRWKRWCIMGLCAVVLMIVLWFT